MESLLGIRESIRYNFGKYEKYFIIGIKFFLNLIVYLWIFSFGNYMDIFARLFEGATMFLYLGVLCVLGIVLPLPYLYFLFAVNIFLQLSTHLIFAGFLLIIMIAMILLYARIAVEESVLILITFFGLILNLPFVAPIVAGLYFGITSFIPVVLGCILYSFTNCFAEYLVLLESNAELQEVGVESLLSVLEFFTYYFSNNNEIISYCVVLVGGIFVIKAIEFLNINFDKYISIAVSGLYFIVTFIFTKILFGFNMGVFAFIIGLILSLVLSVCILFFDEILDYKSTKLVKFEDAENMYYVKVVPKIYLGSKSNKENNRKKEDTKEKDKRIKTRE